jgi:hypothetical protein
VSNVYEQLLENSAIQNSLDNVNEEFEQFVFRWIQQQVRYPLRPYQKKASLILDILLHNPIFLKNTLERVDLETEIPMLTFEMATGSGKTLQMLAHMLYLYKTDGFKDFLIITPGNTIYDKTISNFSPDSFDTEWALDQDLKVNIVTSDNYQEKSCWLHENPDLTIYIFNVQQFYTKASKSKKKEAAVDVGKGTPWVFRPIEDSVWRDETKENVISFVDYLRSRKLAILSDEAHHYQQDTSKNVIIDLKPSVVLEYTATSQHGLQNVVYEYGIKHLINEKFSKRIRLLSFGNYTGNLENKTEVTEEDKRRIMLGLIVHQVKHQSLVPGERPLMLIKARQIDHAKKIEEYLCNIQYEELTFKQVLKDIQFSDSSMARLILDLAKKDEEKLWKLVQSSAFPLRYDSETNQVAKVRQSLANIESSGSIYEVIIAVDALDEGWNVKKLYTIVVLHEGEREIATSVKQLIGRGIRLYREQRIKDSRPIKEQQDELLHIVSVKGRSFDRAITKISQELGLSSHDFGSDDDFIEINWELDSEWESQPLPQVTKEKVSKFRNTSKGYLNKEDAYAHLIDRFVVEKCNETSIQGWLDQISVLTSDQKRILGLLPDGQLKELELYTIEMIQGEQRDLLLESQSTALPAPAFYRVQKDVFEHISQIGQVEIAHQKIYDALKNTLSSFHRVNGVEEWNAHRRLLRSLTLWLGNQIGDFWYNIKTSDEAKNLGELFLEEIKSIPKSKIISNPANWLITATKEEKEMVKSLYFKGTFNQMIFGHGIMADSPFEVEMALKLSEWLEDTPSAWIKNQRQYSIPYKKDDGKWGLYYPDFIIFYNKLIYLLETKGDRFLLEAKPKKVAAEELYDKGYPIVYLFLLYSQRDKMKVNSFDEFLEQFKPSNQQNNHLF